MWRQILSRVTDNVDGEFGRLTDRLHRRLGENPLTIVPYRGYGTVQRLFLKGRVLEDKGLRPAAENDTVWQNLAAMYRRLHSEEVPGAHVRVQFQGMVDEVLTDGEGYFDIDFPVRSALPSQQMWQQLSLSLVGMENAPMPVTAVGQVLTPPASSDFGIISDLDDTVVQTYATDLLKMARVTFLNNARTRLPFAGVAAFYRALQAGPTGRSNNPIFYVSSSPWNLYDLLVDFMDVHQIPTGPLQLRDFSFGLKTISAHGHHGHKLTQIERILATYPHLNFILIGDSGQQDPEIYHQVVHQHPGRAVAVYIRDVSLDERDAEVDAIIQHMGIDNVPMLRAADTVAAATHALDQGLIAESAMREIRVDKAQDVSGPSDVELLLEE